MSTLLIVLAALAIAWILAYHRLPAVAWTIAFACVLALVDWYAEWPQPLVVALWAILVVGTLVCGPTPIRSASTKKPGTRRRACCARSKNERRA